LAVAQLVFPAAVAADNLLEPLPPSPVLYAAEMGIAVGRVAPAVDTAVVAAGMAVATATDIAVEAGIPPTVAVHNSAAPVPELLPAHAVAVEVVAVVVAVAPPLSSVQPAARTSAWVNQQPNLPLQPR
jgi:hypothetical protein